MLFFWNDIPKEGYTQETLLKFAQKIIGKFEKCCWKNIQVHAIIKNNPYFNIIDKKVIYIDV